MAKVSIVKILKQKKYLRVGSVVVLVGIFATLIGTDVWQRINPTKAATRNITGDIYLGVGKDKITSTTYGANDSIVVKNGGRLILDGAHNFGNLTVEDGGVVTTTDYNRYGINNANIEYNNSTDCYASEILNCARNATSLSGDHTSKKTYFSIGGFINLTGSLLTNSDLKFAIGKPEDPAHPDAHVGNNLTDFRIDDYGLLTYFDSVSLAESQAYSFAPSDIAGRVYSNTTTNSGYFTNNASADKPLIPFQLTVVNGGGDFKWGIGRSSADAGSLGDAKDYYLLNLIDNNTAFSTDPVNGYSQVKSSYAIQWNNSGWYSAIDQALLENTTQYMLIWSDYFYTVKNYNMYSDAYVVPTTYTGTVSLEDLSNPQLSAIEAVPHNNSYSGDKYFSFFSKNIAAGSAGANYYYFNTPLAGMPASGSSSFFPYLSNQLYDTLKTDYSFAQKRAVVTVNKNFSLQTGGQINVNGKGFAPGHGPAPASLNAGASHAGLGYAKNSGAYDAIEGVEPKAPGSGGFYHSYSNLNINQKYSLYGGGFIKIISNKIITNHNGLITADAIGFSDDRGEMGAASSGGSIILEDASEDSQYFGVISAWGACTDQSDGSSASKGGGGGGHIFIKTQAKTENQNKLYAAKENSKYIPQVHDRVSDRKGLAKQITGGDYSTFLINSNDLHYQDPNSYPNGSITALGGEADVGDKPGNWGIISILFSQQNTTGQPFKKTLHQVTSPPGVQTPDNPYSLSLGDTIEVKLEFDVAPANGTVITDEPLKTQGSSPITCKCLPATVLPLTGNNCTPSGGAVWNTRVGEKIFSYHCKVE